MSTQIKDVVAWSTAMEVEVKNRKNRMPLPHVPSPASVVQLPMWSELVRGVPNGVLRSALFGVVKKKKDARRLMERARIKRFMVCSLVG